MKKAAVRRRVRAAKETMAAVCQGLMDYDENFYSYDKDVEQWKIMERRLEEVGMMTRREFASAYREVTASAGEKQFARDREKVLSTIDSISAIDVKDPEIKAIIAQAYQIGFSSGCYRWMDTQYKKMRKRDHEFHR